MKRTIYLQKTVLWLFVLVTMSAYGQTAKQTAPPPPKKITSLEGITEYELGNSMKVLLFPDQSKSTMTVNITYLVGSRHEGYGESGMAHLLEHMVFKGTPKHPNIPQELTSHGCRPNGTTWYDRTNYFETFTASDENLKWALDLESDRMINSYIAKKDLESEFSVVRNEFESGENDPGGVLMERIMSTAFLWHNYGKSTIGSREDIERVPIENLQAFYKKYYQPDNAVLTITGKFDEAKTLALVNQYFGGIPKPSRVLQPTYTVEPTQDGERSVVLRRVGDVQVAACCYHIPAGAHPDYPAIAVLAEALTSEPGGRLYKELVESKKASSVYGFSFGLKDPGILYFTTEVLKEKSLEDASKTMLTLLDNVKTTPVTEEEVTRAKNKLNKFLELSYNNADRVGLTLSEYIAKGDWRLWFLYRDRLQQVTAADVNRVAATYLLSSNRTTGMFLPEENPMRVTIPEAKDPKELLKDYKGKEALAQAEAFDPSPANIMARTKTGTIPGGTKYSLLPKTTRGGSVNINMALHIGSAATLQNKGSIPSMTASMLNRGTKKYTYQQMNDAIDNLKATINISGSGQDVTVSVQTVKESVPGVLQLLEEMLRRPTFPAAELDKMIEEELAGIEAQKSEPQAIAFKVFDRITNPYPATDFRYTMTPEEETAAVKALKIAEIQQFYSDYYNGTNATIAIVGDFNEAEAVSGITSIFSNWTSKIPFEKAKDEFFDVTSKTEKIKTPDKKNAMMVCGMNLKLGDNDPDFAALVMGNYLLGGGFLNSRLAVRIRQKEGLSYGVGSYLQAGQTDKVGAFGSYAIFNPTNLEKLKIAYQDEINLLLKNGINDTELKDAINGYLQSRNVSRSQDRELVGRLSNYLYYDRTLAWDADLEKKIAALTVNDINAAVRKWIDPSKITYVEAGDF